MNPNLSSIDRIIRFVVGLGLVGWGIYAHNWLGAIGVVPLLTGLFRFCPLYRVLGLSTCAECCSKKP